MHCPSHFLFTTPRAERGDKVQWILIDSFEFPEIISPRMHQETEYQTIPHLHPLFLPVGVGKILHELVPLDQLPDLKVFQ